MAKQYKTFPKTQDFVLYMVEGHSFSACSEFTRGYFYFPSKKMRSSKASASNVKKFNTADPEDESLTENVVQKKLQVSLNLTSLHVVPALDGGERKSFHLFLTTAVVLNCI